MSTQVAQGLRSLARDNYAGKISREVYRRERRRLLEELTGHPAAATRTLPQKPRPARSEETESVPSAAKPRGLLIGGVAALLLVTIAVVWFAAGRRDSAQGTRVDSNTADAPASPAQHVRILIEDFSIRDDWSAGALRRLGAQWRALPETVREDSMQASWFRPFSNAVHDRVLAHEAYRDITPDAHNSEADLALLSLAREFGIADGDRSLTDERMPPEAGSGAGSSGQADAIEPVGAGTFPGTARRAVLPMPGSADAPEASAQTGLQSAPGRPQAVPAVQGEDPVSGKTVANVPVQAQVAAPSGTGVGAEGAPAGRKQTSEEGASAAAVLQAPVPANAAQADAGAQDGEGCHAGLLQSRRRFCRDALASGGEGPPMYVLPGGVFVMGDTSVASAGPAHEVRIGAPIAIAVYETSVAEFKSYCVATGRRCPDARWPEDDYPVVGVSWDDASAYAAWLSQQTGAAYRLPSEAEWEYAARGGTTTPYPFGAEVLPADARFSYSEPVDAPMPRSNRAIGRNGFRLYHVVGNVREWVADAWHDDHSGAPTDGSARAGGNARVVRGGSYADTREALYSASRAALPKDAADGFTGFRVLRELAP